MKRSELKRLANMLSRQFDQLKTVPGFLSLRFSGLESVDNKIDLQLESEEFIKTFPPVMVDIKQGPDKSWYHARSTLGKLTVTCAMDSSEYKQYFSAVQKHKKHTA